MEPYLILVAAPTQSKQSEKLYVESIHVTVLSTIDLNVTGRAKLAVTFLKNPVQIIIFETRRGRFEKVSFSLFKTKIHKE